MALRMTHWLYTASPIIMGIARLICLRVKDECCKRTAISLIFPYSCPMYCKTQRPDSARLCLCSLPYPLIDDQIQLTDNEREREKKCQAGASKMAHRVKVLALQAGQPEFGSLGSM